MSKLKQLLEEVKTIQTERRENWLTPAKPINEELEATHCNRLKAINMEIDAINDAAFSLSRLAEMYDSIESNRAPARAIMQQVSDVINGRSTR